MRKLVLEASVKESERISGKRPFHSFHTFHKVKTLDVLHFLRHDRNEFAAICRVEFNDQDSKPEDLLLNNDNLDEVQVLEHERRKDGANAYIVYIRAKSHRGSSGHNLMPEGGGYLFTPFWIHDGKIRLTFIGSAKQVKAFLENHQKQGLHYKVVSLTDVSFSPNSLLMRLTKKQRKAITMAYNLGYYDVPRRINSEQLAEKAKLGSSTMVEHLRKAERRLLAQILSES